MNNIKHGSIDHLPMAYQQLVMALRQYPAYLSDDDLIRTPISVVQTAIRVLDRIKEDIYDTTRATEPDYLDHDWRAGHEKSRS